MQVKLRIGVVFLWTSLESPLSESLRIDEFFDLTYSICCFSKLFNEDLTVLRFVLGLNVQASSSFSSFSIFMNFILFSVICLKDRSLWGRSLGFLESFLSEPDISEISVKSLERVGW